jgi:hypothetical protein
MKQLVAIFRSRPTWLPSVLAILLPGILAFGTLQGCKSDGGAKPPIAPIAVSTEGYGCLTGGESSLYQGKLVAWGDLHSHTRLSNDAATIEHCTVDPAGALEIARGVGLDFVTITDHAEDGAPGEYTKAKWDSMMTEAQAFQGRYSLPIVFPGFEYTKSDGRTGTGHRNIICRDFTDVPVRGFGYDTFSRPTELWTFLDQGPAAGNFMCIPHHPAKGGDYDNPNLPLWVDWDASFVTESFQRLVEVYSRHGSSEFAGCEEPVNSFQPDHAVEHALGLWLTTKDPGYKLGFVGGTDTHFGNPGDVAEDPANVDPRLGPYTGGLTAAWVGSKAREAVWAALWGKDCYATSGGRIQLEFTAKMGDALVPMGGTLAHSATFAPEAAAQVNLHIRASSVGSGAITRIQVFRNGLLLADRSDPAWGGTVHLDVQDLLGQDDAYYRVKAWDANHDLAGQGERAWSSPIWVERN